MQVQSWFTVIRFSRKQGQLVLAHCFCSISMSFDLALGCPRSFLPPISFLRRKRGGGRYINMWNIDQLPPICAPIQEEHTAQVHALTRNPTQDLLFNRHCSTQLSHTIQGSFKSILIYVYILWAYNIMCYVPYK